MTEQLAFDLTARHACGRSDFWVAPCNQEAIAWIDKYPNWPMHALLIYGEEGSGKSHLASIFSDEHIEAIDLNETIVPKSQKIVVENVDQLKNEEALFHLFNSVQEMGGGLLMTARKLPVFSLPDLQSRISMIPKAEIKMPDDQTIEAVCAKVFEDKQITVDPVVFSYIATHLTRSFASVQRVLNLADAMALEKGRRITVPLMKEAIEKLERMN
ncbi:MAG: chromosomal replication initiator DnaA [Alphaproteobacteria bacterium]|nr:chromosomal replication initiator DnaA [Alphaproteobacteria bacterium]